VVNGVKLSGALVDPQPAQIKAFFFDSNSSITRLRFKQQLKRIVKT
jgi:hypothetical protein